MDLLKFGFYIFYIVISLLTAAYFLLRKRYDYWAERGIVHDPPVLVYGHFRELGKKPLRELMRDHYVKYKHVAPFCGFYIFLRRAVVLFDLDLIKNILIRDFANFSHRGHYYNEKDDPLSAHLVNLDGQRWKRMRAKLTPAFTTGKMKFMFTTVVDVAEQFIGVLNDKIEQNSKGNTVDENTAEIEITNLLARYTTDVIGLCAFGLHCNCLKDPNAPFRLMGKKAFGKRRHGSLVIGIMTAFPNVARKLGMKLITDDVAQFFTGVLRKTIAYREREHVPRNDFVNLLVELIKRNQIDGLTIEEATAQALIFFLAGFETSSSAMGFALYELALHQHIQDKARAEINAVLERYEGKFTYEGFSELKYLKQIFQETLRVYSIATLLRRKAINDYKVPGTDFIIEKDVTVLIPVDAIHRDPEIYPDPEKFDPSRFDPTEVEKRHAMSWLPFGEGPRNCIGLRFGEMQSLIGLALLLKNFKFHPSKDTNVPIEMNPKSFVLTPKNGIVLKLEKI